MKQTIKQMIPPKYLRRVKFIVLRIFGRNTVKGKSGNMLVTNNAIMRNCSVVFHGKNNHIVMGGVIF